ADPDPQQDDEAEHHDPQDRAAARRARDQDRRQKKEAGNQKESGFAHCAVAIPGSLSTGSPTLVKKPLPPAHSPGSERSLPSSGMISAARIPSALSARNWRVWVST